MTMYRTGIARIVRYPRKSASYVAQSADAREGERRDEWGATGPTHASASIQLTPTRCWIRDPDCCSASSPIPAHPPDLTRSAGVNLPEDALSEEAASLSPLSSRIAFLNDMTIYQRGPWRETKHRCWQLSVSLDHSITSCYDRRSSVE